MLAAVESLEMISLTVNDQLVIHLQNFRGPGGEDQDAFALQRHHGEEKGRTTPVFGQGTAGQR